MEIKTELLEKIKKDNPEFKKLIEEHALLKSKVEELNKLKFLTAEQEIEKKTTQKKKLRMKDRLDEILSQYESTLH
ncbi:MAG: DUF465 domain-containing protein [Nitrospinaceae bacterium]|nr:DUF465 domain-containing protein [Nitrospinaceae bacterium]NIR54362.1 DUF465 domain-containing protein [Nitrospinaceae bacterium]NIS84780.1 DUF465 domain-containing protein [Nitrospinaceae bacterium]NIT81581.1 DUF465 domain-containing protein [Nitrospinaceae bacterium]NIU43865.1 DUF465 domain-containing protein [Nitrospinaceae bacterium]